MAALLCSAKVVLHASSDIYKIAAWMEEPYKSLLRNFRAMKHGFHHHSGDKKLSLGVIQYLFPNLRSIELNLFPKEHSRMTGIWLDHQSVLFPPFAEMRLSKGLGSIHCDSERATLLQQQHYVLDKSSNFNIDQEIKDRLLTTNSGKCVTKTMLEYLKLFETSREKSRVRDWFFLLISEAKSRQINVTTSGQISLCHNCHISWNGFPQSHMHSDLVVSLFIVARLWRELVSNTLTSNRMPNLMPKTCTCGFI